MCCLEIWFNSNWKSLSCIMLLRMLSNKYGVPLLHADFCVFELGIIVLWIRVCACFASACWFARLSSTIFSLTQRVFLFLKLQYFKLPKFTFSSQYIKWHFRRSCWKHLPHLVHLLYSDMMVVVFFSGPWFAFGLLRNFNMCHWLFLVS